MWSNPLSAALLYGVLSTTFVAGQGPASNNNQVSPTFITSFTSEIVGPTDSPQPTISPQPSRTDGLKGGEGSGLSGEKGGASGSASPSSTPENTVASASGVRKSAGNSNNTGAIAGGVVGGVLFLVLVGALIFFLRKRKKARDPFGSMEKSGESSSTLSQSLIAY